MNRERERVTFMLIGRVKRVYASKIEHLTDRGFRDRALTDRGLRSPR